MWGDQKEGGEVAADGSQSVDLGRLREKAALALS